MFKRLKAGLTVAKRAIRPSSLYSNRSSAEESDATDRDSLHSEPSELYAAEDDIYSPVTFGDASPYEVPVPLTGAKSASDEALYDDVYCSRYDIYEEYGFDNLYEPIDYENTQVLFEDPALLCSVVDLFLVHACPISSVECVYIQTRMSHGQCIYSRCLLWPSFQHFQG